MAHKTLNWGESTLAHDIENFRTSLDLDDHVPFRLAKLSGEAFLKRIDGLRRAAATNATTSTLITMDSSARDAVINSFKEPEKTDTGRWWVENIVCALEAYLAEVTALRHGGSSSSDSGVAKTNK